MKYGNDPKGSQLLNGAAIHIGEEKRPDMRYRSGDEEGHKGIWAGAVSLKSSSKYCACSAAPDALLKVIRWRSRVRADVL